MEEKKKHPTRMLLEEGQVIDEESLGIMLKEERQEKENEILLLILSELKSIKQLLIDNDKL